MKSGFAALIAWEVVRPSKCSRSHTSCRLSQLSETLALDIRHSAHSHIKEGCGAELNLPKGLVIFNGTMPLGFVIAAVLVLKSKVRDASLLGALSRVESI